MVDTMLRRDQWGKDPYKTIYGDKALNYCKISADKARVQNFEKGWVIFGDISCDQGIVRSYKPELPCETCLTKIQIFSKTYTTKRKNSSGEYEFIQVEPSLHEQELCSWLSNNAEKLNLAENYFSCSIEFLTDAGRKELFSRDANFNSTSYWNFTQIDNDGTLPNLLDRRSNNYKSRDNSSFVSVGDNSDIVKEKLIEALKDNRYSTDDSLIDLLIALAEKYRNTPGLFEKYIDLLGVVFR